MTPIDENVRNARYVKFKRSSEPCWQYEVADVAIVNEYDKLLDKVCPCIELKLMGLTPIELLEEATCPDNENAIELFIQLSKD